MSPHALARPHAVRRSGCFTAPRVPAWLALLAVASVSLAPAAAVAQGVQYTLLPSASYVRWDEGLKLERALMFGGRALADFGPLVGLEGHYLTGGGIVARFAETGLVDSLGATLENGTLDVTDYGLGIRVNFGRAGLAPFVRASGSVLRFDDGARKGPRQIAVSYGGGIRFNASPRMRAELFAEDKRFRVDRSALASAATAGTDPQRNEMRSNLTFGAGLGFVIGGGRPEDGPRERWSIASVPIEAFTGRLDFNDAALGAHSLVGVRGGLDAGNYVGLRAYYLSGVSSGYSKLEGVRSLGGEAQFNLNAAPRLAPYLVIGGGTLGFQSGFRDATGAEPADRTVLILGGGIGFRLGEKFRLNLAARDFIHGRVAELDDVRTVSELRNNWLYSAGIGVNIGRSSRGIALVPTATGPGSDSSAAAPDAAARAIAQTDSAPGAAAVIVVPVSPIPMGDSAVGPTAERGYHSGRTVVLPLPTQGELYIRYGPAPVRDSTANRASGPGLGAGAAPGGIGAGAGAAPGTMGTAPVDTVPPGVPDSAQLAAAITRGLADRWRLDSALIRGLVALEVDRQMARANVGQRPAGITPDPAATPGSREPAGDSALLAALRTERDSERMERMRLQARLDSLEAAFVRQVAERTAVDQTRSQQAAIDSAAAARARAIADADRRGAEELERQRAGALAMVERSLPSVTAVADTDRGLVIVLGNDLFAVGQDSLGSRARIELRAVATLLSHYPDAAILVEGHTDATGAADANQRLSEARAESVRSALIAHGTPSERITARGYGQTQPVGDNATADGRARNRRAEVVILGADRPRQTAGR